MDRLDLAILRAMAREKVLWWGGLDPRVSTDVLARRAGVAGSTVRARIRRWERTGFLRGYNVLPNPRLFGARIAGGSVRVDDPRRKPAVLSDLGLVDGVLGALDHVGPWIAVSYVFDRPEALARTQRLVSRLAGVDEVPPCEPFDPPATTVVPRPADWRLLAALRAEPRAPVARIAARVGISTRTFTRRYQALVAGRGVFFSPLLDFSKSEGGVVARLIVLPRTGAHPGEVAKRLQGAFPDLMELWNPREGTEGEEIDVLIHRPTLGAVEDAHRAALDVPGVEAVEVVYPRADYAFPAWIDAHIEDALRDG